MSLSWRKHAAEFFAFCIGGINRKAPKSFADFPEPKERNDPLYVCFFLCFCSYNVAIKEMQHMHALIRTITKELLFHIMFILLVKHYCLVADSIYRQTPNKD